MKGLDDIIEVVNKNIKGVFLNGVKPDHQEAYIIDLELTLDRLARQLKFAQNDSSSELITAVIICSGFSFFFWRNKYLPVVIKHNTQYRM